MKRAKSSTFSTNEETEALISSIRGWTRLGRTSAIRLALAFYAETQDPRNQITKEQRKFLKLVEDARRLEGQADEPYYASKIEIYQKKITKLKTPEKKNPQAQEGAKAEPGAN
jgi:hypothetical protein